MTQTKKPQSVDHVVIMVQENHTTDNYFRSMPAYGANVATGRPHPTPTPTPPPPSPVDEPKPVTDVLLRDGTSLGRPRTCSSTDMRRAARDGRPTPDPGHGKRM
ncbi:hypothetical protein [Kitasatospora sp. NPDC058190]|uniref:hypothetical protein n=1 Tax=Kitasatospora sp. NPDC058190 TaxID=3346371 RepID=UPI0036DF4A71